MSKKGFALSKYLNDSILLDMYSDTLSIYSEKEKSKKEFGRIRYDTINTHRCTI